MHSEEPTPHYVGHVIFEEELTVFQTSELDVRKEDTVIEEGLNLFLSKNKYAVHFVVPDDTMEPRFVQGGVVAGIRLHGKHIRELI